jgi:hypothetical protein
MAAADVKPEIKSARLVEAALKLLLLMKRLLSKVLLVLLSFMNILARC